MTHQFLVLVIQKQHKIPFKMRLEGLDFQTTDCFSRNTLSAHLYNNLFSIWHHSHKNLQISFPISLQGSSVLLFFPEHKLKKKIEVHWKCLIYSSHTGQYTTSVLLLIHPHTQYYGDCDWIHAVSSLEYCRWLLALPSSFFPTMWSNPSLPLLQVDSEPQENLNRITYTVLWDC